MNGAPLPRVIHDERGVEVYAPVCPECGSDDGTFWDGDLATGLREHHGRTVALEAWCEDCLETEDEENFYEWTPTRAEIYRAREPERLERRLAELKKECAA